MRFPFLDEAHLYLVASAQMRAGKLAELVPELAAAGVDLIQLREKEMEGLDLIRVGAPVAEACKATGVPFVINDRIDVALALEADGVHLGMNDLSTKLARRMMPDAFVGRSSHSETDLQHVLVQEDPDLFAAGPVFETPTKPGRPAAGLGYIRHVAAAAPSVPWFAIGGIDEENLDQVLETGARRIVVVRAITESAEPAEAASRLRRRLLEAAS